MKPRTKLWFEDGNALVLSEFRVQLLRHIDESGSIVAAAKAMGLPYRRALEKVREIEANLGMHLVESVIGGSGGGGSRLTDEARTLVQRFERFRTAMDRHAQLEFDRAFSPEPVSNPTR